MVMIERLPTNAYAYAYTDTFAAYAALSSRLWGIPNHKINVALALYRTSVTVK